MNIRKLLLKLRDAVWTPRNVEKVGKVVYDAAVNQAKKMTAKEPSKGHNKAGLADPVSLALIFAGGMLLGCVFGHGVNTRSIVVNIEKSHDITVKDLKVEVSGSGGVSVPLTGGGK